MSCSVYFPGRTLLTAAVTLIVGLAAWAYFLLPRADLSPVVRIGAGAFAAAALLACAFRLLARKPVVRVDETGIAYHPKLLPKIEWPDVLGVERAPLIEPTSDGLVNHVQDGRRPVNVFVLGSDKYLPRLPTALRQRLFVDEKAGWVRFQIEFAGLSPASAEVYDCIRRHLDGREASA